MKKYRAKRPLYRLLALLTACLLTISAPKRLAAQGEDEVTPEVQQLYAQAKQAQQRGDDSTAIEKYKAMLKLAPHLAAGYNNLGLLYFNGHDYVHAAETLEHGLKLNPAMPSASAMLGMSYFQMGQDAKAEPLLVKALKAKPEDDQIEMVLVHILINQKKFDEAALHLKSFLARNPRDQEAWYLLGKSYVQLSENALRKINEIDPNSIVAHEITGEIDESMHNYDLALVEYKKAIDLAPNQPGTHMHMGDAFWNMSKWESAQAEFKAELANDPNNCLAHWKLADSILEGNDSNEAALVEANKAVERCPTLMQARVDRARALIRLGKHPEALPDLLMAEKETPSEPSIHFLLAAVYRAQGKSTEAQQEMKAYGTLERDARTAVATQAQESNSIKSTSK